jgi:hypothetical protein
MARRWAALVRPVVTGISHAELEQRRWGPGGRAHFADPRPGDFPGRAPSHKPNQTQKWKQDEPPHQRYRDIG